MDDILEASWCSGVRDATTAWAALRVDAVTDTATNSDYVWMAPGSNYLTFEVSWDLVDEAYVPVIGGLFCTNVPAGSCDATNPPPTRYDAGADSNLNLLVPGTDAPGSGAFTVILHNTTNTVPPGGKLLFNLVSSETLDVPATNWLSEMLLWGIPNESNVTAVVDKADRGNLFFWAYSISNAATIAELESLRYSTGIVNGVTNTYYSNPVAAEPILYSINMGYGGEDHYGALYGGGLHQNTDTNPFPNDVLDPQGVTGLYLDPSARLSVTNIFMSHNPLTSVDLANCQKLRIAEFYNCDQLSSIALSNCPNLFRACFERCNLSSIDYSGCPNLVDIRLAWNHVTNIVFGGSEASAWMKRPRSLSTGLPPYSGGSTGK